jgi:ribonuclease-3
LNRAHAELGRRLQYAFSDPGLLERALTHRSKSQNNYERLEFLGDSVLNFVVSAELFERYPARRAGA